MALTRTFIVAAILVATAPWLPAQAPANEKLARDEFNQGDLQLEHHEYFEALKHLTRANQLRGNNCAECLVEMAEAMLGMKAYPNVLETAAKAIDAAAGDVKFTSRAHQLRGDAFQAMAEKDATKYRDAEQEFRAALTINPRIDETARFNLALVLLKQGRDDEAKAELQRVLETRTDSLADDAQALLANPRRGRENYAPEFAITAVDGTKLSPELLHGKVVLMDFWATTCGPCVQAVPALKKLQKAHAADPFVIVSVSGDEDESQWRRFTVKNEMTWPQYFDSRRGMSSEFHVVTHPTYVLLDGEGIERLRVVGTGFDRSKELSAAIEREITKALPATRP